MRRRDFMGLLGGTAALSSGMGLLAAHAQQSGPVRRIGVIMGYAGGDAEGQVRVTALQQGLAEHGWTAGRNVRLDIRFAAGEPQRMRAQAAEIVASAPDVIVVHTTPATAAVLAETRTIPIVFMVVSDPIGSGFVESLARPGGNITGFVNLESSLIEKWIELLKQVAPHITRAAVLYNPETAPYAPIYLRPFEAAARILKVEPIAAPAHDNADIESVIASLEPDGGLVVMTDIFTAVHRDLIVGLAARHRVPAVYSQRSFGPAGGLICYGVDTIDLFRRAGTTIDRILKGGKPGEIPVQGPSKFELLINLKTAKTLGLTVSLSLQTLADEVIE
jgi:putative tryptophan/tyrosine transport system substrate-binding protein